MRIKNSILNLLAILGSQVISIMLGFISRTIFITTLGAEYLGVNGLFTNILSIMSLAESGIGSSIIFSLYKPVAENDEDKILVLMRLYKRAFTVIGGVIFTLGIITMPFLKYMIQGETSVKSLYLIYFIFVFNTAISYLFTYKVSFLNVCQKKYVVTWITAGFSTVGTIIKICILKFTGNYIAYLIADSVITLLSSVTLMITTNKMYPVLKRKTDSRLDEDTRHCIIKNVKSVIIHNIGGRVVFGTDNLLISAFVNLAAVGIYSNYNMLISLSRNLINNIFDAIEHSIGNLIAEETEDKIYSVFKTTMLCSFWANAFFSIGMYICLEPVVRIWIGEDFLLGKSVTAILMINFYVSGMRKPITMVKSKAGIFYEDRIAPLFEAGINLVASIILVKLTGLGGIFLGTIISTLTVPFWVAPYLVYKKVFAKSCKSYFAGYLKYTLTGLVTCMITEGICSFVHGNPITEVLIKIGICCIVPNVIFLMAFWKKEEFQYLLMVAKGLFGPKIKKMHIKKQQAEAA